MHASRLEELAESARGHAARQEDAAALADWQAAPGWTRRLGPFAPVALVLVKGKFFLSLLKLKFVLSFATFSALYWALYGVWFGIGLAVLILVHELGRLIEVRRFARCCGTRPSTTCGSVSPVSRPSSIF